MTAPPTFMENRLGTARAAGKLYHELHRPACHVYWFSLGRLSGVEIRPLVDTGWCSRRRSFEHSDYRHPSFDFSRHRQFRRESDQYLPKALNRYVQSAIAKMKLPTTFPIASLLFVTEQQ